MSDPAIRAIVRGAYDLQKMRIQAGNRIVANWKVKMGQVPGESEEDGMNAEAKELLATIRASYRKIADAMKVMRKKFPGDGVIDTWSEFALVKEHEDLSNAEDGQFKLLGRIVADAPIWIEFLDGVKGVGPAIAGVLLSEIDIAKARHPSSLWKYAGLDVGPDGRGRGKYKEHLVRVTYTAKDGTEKERDSITFNPFLKTKLLGVLAGSFLKCANPDYAPIYHDERTRLENDPRMTEVSKLQAHRRALRKMVKIFLIDLYTHWRAIEGLPVSTPYCEDKLGMAHGQN